LISVTRRTAPLDVVPRIHRPIVEALPSGDPDRAERAAQEHVEYGRGVLLSGFPAGPFNGHPRQRPESRLPR
jgi:DNA-binding GntR family transcriptional regulator